MTVSVYEIVTARILESLALGVAPWRNGWASDRPKNLVSGREYRGVNVFLLASTPYESPWWLTFKQARDLGGTVKRGEHGCPVVFWRVGERETEKGEKEKSVLLRYFMVFNVQQCEGIEAPGASTYRLTDPIEECEAIVSGYANPPRIDHGGGAAFYAPALDRIQVPGRRMFASLPEYYSTIFHEIVHSTGHPSRLARKGVVAGARFASHDYSFEELVAEMGAAFLCAEGGISPSTIENSAAYLGSWMKRLKSEPRWIVDAAAQASKAADLVLGRHPELKTDPAQEAA